MSQRTRCGPLHDPEAGMVRRVALRLTRTSLRDALVRSGHSTDVGGPEQRQLEPSP
jgi:hypothetical protein